MMPCVHLPNPERITAAGFVNKPFVGKFWLSRASTNAFTVTFSTISLSRQWRRGAPVAMLFLGEIEVNGRETAVRSGLSVLAMHVSAVDAPSEQECERLSFYYEEGRLRSRFHSFQSASSTLASSL